MKKIKNCWQKISHYFNNRPYDRASLIDILHDAYKLQIIDQTSLSMLEGVLGVTELRVRDVMIPRAQIIAIKQADNLSRIIPIILQSAHSRFPVLKDNEDQAIGILLAKDLLAYGFNNINQTFKMKDLLRPAIVVPESKRLDVLLQEFRLNRNHMAIVVNEYDKLTGLITIEDVLEQIVGDIEDEYDIDDEIFIKKHAINRFSAKASIPIEDFNDFFKADFNNPNIETISGLILQHLGYLPKIGESISIGKFNFKILRANIRRIILVQITISTDNE